MKQLKTTVLVIVGALCTDDQEMTVKHKNKILNSPSLDEIQNIAFCWIPHLLGEYYQCDWESYSQKRQQIYSYVYACVSVCL